MKLADFGAEQSVNGAELGVQELRNTQLEYPPHVKVDREQ